MEVDEIEDLMKIEALSLEEAVIGKGKPESEAKGGLAALFAPTGSNPPQKPMSVNHASQPLPNPHNMLRMTNPQSPMSQGVRPTPNNNAVNNSNQPQMVASKGGNSTIPSVMSSRARSMLLEWESTMLMQYGYSVTVTNLISPLPIELQNLFFTTELSNEWFNNVDAKKMLSVLSSGLVALDELVHNIKSCSPSLQQVLCAVVKLCCVGAVAIPRIIRSNPRLRLLITPPQLICVPPQTTPTPAPTTPTGVGNTSKSKREDSPKDITKRCGTPVNLAFTPTSVIRKMKVESPSTMASTSTQPMATTTCAPNPGPVYVNSGPSPVVVSSSPVFNIRPALVGPYPQSPGVTQPHAFNPMPHPNPVMVTAVPVPGPRPMGPVFSHPMMGPSQMPMHHIPPQAHQPIDVGPRPYMAGMMPPRPSYPHFDRMESHPQIHPR